MFGGDELEVLRSVVEPVGGFSVDGEVLRVGTPVADVEEILEDGGGGLGHVVGCNTAGTFEAGEGEAGSIGHDSGRDALGLGTLGVGPLLEFVRSLVGVEGAVLAAGK